MLYFKLINSSFKRNMRSYGPYLMATIMLVAINYIFLAIEANSSLKKLNTGAVTSAMLDLGFKFIFLVTLAFLIYVNRFLWQQRSREIGLYSMLGMTSHNLQLLTIIEKCYLMVISLVAGLAFGIIFEKLAFLSFCYLLNIGHISQPWFVSSAITKTIILTGCLFAIIMVIDLVKLHRLTPNQLWHPEAVTPKRHGILYSIAGILGFALLIWAYYITLTIKPKISAISHFLLAVILLVIGTYLVFIIGSIILLKLLQKNSHFYYKPRHFIAVSGMIQRMQQNGASLATICLLCSSILVILFTSITLYVGIGSTVKSYAPEDVVITSNQGLTKEQKRVINTSARQHHAKINHYLTYKMTTPQYGYWRDNKFISQGSIQKMDSKASSSVILLTTNEYNRITNQHVHLTGNEALTYTNNKGHDGTLIVNKPQSLRDCNEKLFTAWFSDLTPETLVTRNKAQLKAFWEKHSDIILKPLDGMGGASIFRVKEGDPNLGVIAETLTEHGTRYCMAQNYLPAIKDGDKRVLVVDGEPVPYCLARIPQGGETRGNLAAGGRGEPRPLTESDWKIARQIGPTLKEKGLIFVGLDIIGDRLTEINVTSPTCIREIEAEFPVSITGMLMDAIEARLQQQ